MRETEKALKGIWFEPVWEILKKRDFLEPEEELPRGEEGLGPLHDLEKAMFTHCRRLRLKLVAMGDGERVCDRDCEKCPSEKLRLCREFEAWKKFLRSMVQIRLGLPGDQLRVHRGFVLAKVRGQ